jgi:ferredoxin
MDTGPVDYPQPGYSPAGGPAAGPPQGGYRTPVRSEFQGGGKFGVSKHKDMLSIEVNPNKCARFGFCEHEAPEVFYLESDGRFGYQATVPVSKMEEVITAMDVCPRRAIKVKIPADYDPLAIMQPQEDPRQETRRTVIPIMGERQPEDDAPRPRRA